ncbi:MAG TPA: AEC family transporter [Campylobacterales bacterium]|nr:AEC family transporter [Campylobacterales bacterium]
MIENISYLFIIFILGVILKRRFEKNIDALIDFIIYISLPSLVFSQIYTLDIKISIINDIVFGWLITIFSIILSAILGKILNLSRESLISFIMVSSFGNTAFLGYPYIQTLLGDKALGYAIIFDNFASFLPVITIGTILISMENRYRFKIKKIIFSPPFLALILAFLAKSIQIPEALLVTFDALGSTVTPLALFTVGVKLDFSKLQTIKYPIFFSLFIKMILIPLLAIFLYKELFDIDLKAKSILLEIAMPPMVLASIMVMKAKLDSSLATASVGFGVILSFITVPIIFYITSSIY